MDFRRLSRIPLPQGTLNGSEPSSLTEIPANILDALVPGYSLISKYLQAALGIDISLIVSLVVICLGLTKGGQYLYSRLSRAFRYLFVSSVYIEEHDDLFDMLMDWLAALHATSSRRNVWAKTQRGPKGNDQFDAAAANAVDSDGMFDYSRWSARTPPRYEPYYGRHLFWHNGRPFLFHRSQKTTIGQQITIRNGNSSEDDVIHLECMGRSIEPIRDLISTIKVWSLQRKRNTTTIRHPTPKDRARFAGAWSKTFSRPSRPMDTVILDPEQKDMIINDMNEFLHPSSPKWYATRGIPYRRGYLFHGPPGTGKTSLSFALAGIFGLEIYVISLQEPTLTEGDLMQLFNGLPRRCIVLLEDVDAAGLIRDGKSDPESGNMRERSKRGWRSAKNDTEKSYDRNGEAETETKANQKTNKDEEYTLKDLAQVLKSMSAPRIPSERPQANTNRQPGTGISLSGLLNAIDGVASHEGRVLIMTTNHPEKLDAALVRPGRVDRRVEFTMAARDQIKELFYRMYVSVEEKVPENLLMEHQSSGKLNGSANGRLPEKMPNGRAENDSALKEKLSTAPAILEDLAIEFAALVPDDTFTPAQIQNHLMRYKNEPRKAVEKVDDWMRETLAEEDKKNTEQGENDEVDEDNGDNG